MSFPLINPSHQFFDTSGAPLVNGTLEFRDPTTNSLINSYPTADDADAQTNANANPLTLDARGGYTGLYLEDGVAYKVILKDSSGATIDTQDDVLCPTVLPYSQSAAELAAGVTPVNTEYPPGDIRRYGTNTSPGTTDMTTAVQNALTANAGDVPVVFPQGESYRLISRVTAPADTEIILQNGAELYWSATTNTGTSLLGTASSPGIEVTGNNFRLSGNGTLKGPSSATYVVNEAAILGIGTSTSSRQTGFVIDGDIEITQWGAYGVILQFVSDIRMSGFHIHDIGFMGAGFMSCDNGDIYSFDIGNIAPGTSGNAYGLSLTHDTTSYSTNPNPGTKSATHPFCWDFQVHDCTIYDIILWTGLDAHGCYDCHFYNFNTYNCRHGVGIANSSGDAAGYGGERNSVYNGYITTIQRDGTATTVTETDRLGLVMNGGATTNSINPRAHDLIIEGYGDTSLTSYSLGAVYVEDADFHNITFRDWSGQAVYTSVGTGGIMHGLVFESPASTTGARCIFLDTAATAQWTITGCIHRGLTGLKALAGVRVNDGSNLRGLFANNDFSDATNAYENFDGEQTLGPSDVIPVIEVTGTPTTIDVTPAGNAPLVFVNLNVSGPSTVTTITGSFVGQRIVLYSPTTNVTTLNRDNAFLDGAANYISTQYDVLEVMISTTPSTVVEISRTANS